tara:strand:+ start:1278 stop:1457 length:180 start_codon:yes stop_codon:yes gene_type:complete
MQVGDLVKVRGINLERIGIVIKVPPYHDFWGNTVVVEWLEGFREELERDQVEAICSNLK